VQGFLILRTADEVDAVLILNLGKQRQGEIKYFSQNHTARKENSWGLTSGFLAPEGGPAPQCPSLTSVALFESGVRDQCQGRTLVDTKDGAAEPSPMQQEGPAWH
jgi:hypothetical protein